jgi:hypothetical protein
VKVHPVCGSLRSTLLRSLKTKGMTGVIFSARWLHERNRQGQNFTNVAITLYHTHLLFLSVGFCGSPTSVEFVCPLECSNFLLLYALSFAHIHAHANVHSPMLTQPHPTSSTRPYTPTYTLPHGPCIYTVCRCGVNVDPKSTSKSGECVRLGQVQQSLGRGHGVYTRKHAGEH